MQDWAITFDGAGKQFDDRWVVEDLDLRMPRGAIFGMIGPSGCGKTTTVRMANGVYRPDAGQVTLLGREPTKLRARERAAIGYLPQQPALFAELSLHENLNFHAALNGVRFRRRQRLLEVLELVGLEGEGSKLVANSSGGMRRRLALAATLVHRPAVLILDEPTAGIDPILRRRFWGHFRELANAGHTLIVTTQHVNEAAECDQIGLLADGHVVATGSPTDLRRAAVGGEVIHLATEQPIDGATSAELARVAGALRYEYVGPLELRFVVEQCGVALPTLVGELQRRQIATRTVHEVTPDYDEVFIALVDADRRQSA